jgi:hypothetical protein
MMTFRPSRVGAGDQGVEIGQGPEDRIDAGIVRDVIAEVLHRRGEEGRQPDAVHTQRGDVVQMGGDPRQIADAVAVRVGEAARIDLIQDAPRHHSVGASVVTVGWLRVWTFTRGLPIRRSCSRGEGR